MYATLVIGMGYVMWEKGKGRKWVGLCMLTVFPVISLILLTGANFDINTSLFIWTGILFIISYILLIESLLISIGLLAIKKSFGVI